MSNPTNDRVTIGDASFHVSDTHIHLLPQPLVAIPSDIWRLVGMRRLMVSLHNLLAFPAPPTPELRIPGLEFFSADGSGLARIPPSVWKAIPGLKTLLLSRNELEASALDEAFAHLPELNMFDAWRNKLKRLPASLHYARKLRILILSENEIGELPEANWDDLSMLFHLDLSHNNISHLPSDLGVRLCRLSWLDLGHNKLEALPDSIGGLTELRYLSLRGNALTELPQSMHNLIRLVVLDVADNRLTQVPLKMIKLSNLEALHMEKNSITHLSLRLDQAPRLKILNVSLNRIHKIAETLILSQLEVFDVSKNYALRDFPNEIGMWGRLQKINVSDTAIAEVPPSLGRLGGGLWVLDIHNTNIPQPDIGKIERLVSFSTPQIVFRPDADPIVGARPQYSEMCESDSDDD